MQTPSGMCYKARLAECPDAGPSDCGCGVDNVKGEWTESRAPLSCTDAVSSRTVVCSCGIRQDGGNKNWPALRNWFLWLGSSEKPSRHLNSEVKAAGLLTRLNWFQLAVRSLDTCNFQIEVNKYKNKNNRPTGIQLNRQKQNQNYNVRKGESS